MKQLYLIILSFIFSVTLSAETLTQQAEKAYSEDNFVKALELYDSVAANEGISSDLLYNIGNCYYRLDQNGRAILYYERALSINPANGDARTNLDFVNSKIIDKTNVDEANIIIEITRDIQDWMSSNGWATLAIIMFIIFLAAVALYIFATSVMARKVGFFGGIILFVLVIIANYYAFSSYNKINDRKYAIITTPSVTLSTSPREPKDKSEEAFILNEGTKIYILDSIETVTNQQKSIWYDIKADDIHRAWINKKNIEII